MAFRQKRGTLHTGMRIERAAAQIVCQQANMNRKKGAEAFSLTDFMPHADEPVATLEEAMESWG